MPCQELARGHGHARWLTGQVIGVDGGQMLHRAFDASPWVESVFGADRMRGLVS